MIALAAALIRLSDIGSLVGHEDEQFYLLVGDQMLHHHAIPYVDVWDRKPVGLFLLYAAIRLLGGLGIVQYQVVASVCVAATAGLIGVWLRRAAGATAAVFAALLYLAVLQANLGFSGQAEVFVNFFVVAAGFIVFGALQRPEEAATAPRGVIWRGVIAMLLIGIAIQIKPTALFPGGWLGLVLLLIGSRAGWSPLRLASAAGAWILIAAAPTLMIAAWYAATGHFDALLFANVSSFISKGSDGVAAETQRRVAIVLRLGLPFGLGAALLIYGWWRRRPAAPPLDRLVFLLGWLTSGVAAFLCLTAAYPYYALIMAPMGCLIVGYAIGLGGVNRWLMVAATLLITARMLVGDYHRVEQNQLISPQIQTIADRIRPELKGGCLYVFHGPVVLYTLTNSCLATRFVFPNHLSTQPEATGLGIDPQAEVAAILRKRPPVIVDGVNRFHPPNLVTQGLLHQRLAADYEPFAEIKERSGEPVVVAYRLKASARPLSSVEARR